MFILVITRQQMKTVLCYQQQQFIYKMGTFHVMTNEWKQFFLKI